MQGFKVETNYPFHVFFPPFWGVWKLEKDHPWRILRVPQNTFVFSGASPLPVGVHVTPAQGGRRGWLDLRAWGRGRSCKMRGIFSFISIPGICGCWRRRSPKHNRCFFCFFCFFCIAQKIGVGGRLEGTKYSTTSHPQPQTASYVESSWEKGRIQRNSINTSVARLPFLHISHLLPVSLPHRGHPVVTPHSLQIQPCH